MAADTGTPRGGSWRETEYRGHKVEVHLNEREYSVLDAEAERQGKRRGALLRETFLRAYPAGDTPEVSREVREGGDHAP